MWPQKTLGRCRRWNIGRVKTATLSLQIIYGTQFTLRHFHLFLSWMKNTFAVGWRWSLQRGFTFIDADFFWWKRTNRSGPLAVSHSVIQPHTVFAYETHYCRMQGTIASPRIGLKLFNLKHHTYDTLYLIYFYISCFFVFLDKKKNSIDR